MLSTFPILFTYSMVGPLVLRVVLGVTLAYFGYRKVRGTGQSSGSNSAVFGWAEVVIGVFLVIGLFTQIAALLNIIILVIKLIRKAMNKQLLTDGVNYYILLLAMAIAVLFAGPGYCAVDVML